MDISERSALPCAEFAQDKRMLEAVYKDGGSLRAKHHCGGTETWREFPTWALNHVPLSSSLRLLDAGCGWGRFTWTLIEQFQVAPERIVCGDRFPGMLHTLRSEAAQRDVQVAVCACDIAALPFPSDTFDGVLANHVLYHLPDLAAGVGELARVVKPDGWLLATTNSEQVRIPMIAFHYHALESLGVSFVPEGSSPFSMENGDAWLQRTFRRVERHYLESETLFYNADDLLAVYLTTGRYQGILARNDVAESVKQELPQAVRAQAADVIDREGVLRSPGLMGAFVCTDPIGKS